MTDYLEEMAYKLQLKLELRNYPRGGQREHDLIRDALEDVYKDALANSKPVSREWAHAHLGTMAVSSVRYALGRQTDAVGQTCAAIRWAASKLDAKTLDVMARDIREAKGQRRIIGTDDELKWIGLLAFLEQRLAKLAKREAGQLSGNSE